MPKTLASGENIIIRLSRVDPQKFKKKFINGLLEVELDNPGNGLTPLFAMAQLENATSIAVNSCKISNTNIISIRCLKVSDGTPYNGDTTGDILVILFYTKS